MKSFERKIHKDFEEFYKNLCIDLNKKLKNKNVKFSSHKLSVFYQYEKDGAFYEISVSYELLGGYYKIYYNNSYFDFYSIYAYSFKDLIIQLEKLLNLFIN